MRFTGLMMICVPMAMSGIAYVTAIRKRANLCRVLSDFLTELARFISQTGSTLGAALGYLSEKEKYRSFSFITQILGELSNGNDLCTSWLSSVNGDGELTLLSSDERSIFSLACECFDAADTDELSARLAVFADRLSESAENGERKLGKNGTAAVGLSTLGAAALFIILI